MILPAARPAARDIGRLLIRGDLAARIYRRPVKPDGFLVAVEGGMPACIEGIADTGCIAANGSSIAVADRAGNLYASDDFGRAWSCRSTRLPTPSGVLIC